MYGQNAGLASKNRGNPHGNSGLVLARATTHDAPMFDELAERIVDARNTLGEGPFWRARENRLYWVDIEEGRVHRYHPESGETRAFDIHRRVSLILEDERGGMMLGVQGGLISFDPASGPGETLCSLDANIEGQRTNDGACDARGRLWVGTMQTDCQEGAGRLYRIGPDLSPTCMGEGMSIPNGLCWSHDHRVMYHIDSPKGRVDRYLYDLESGSITPDGVAVMIPSDLGVPDGMTIDAEGMLWVAHYGGGGVYRWNPEDGNLLGRIRVPALQVTACAFGGEDLQTLFITTARQHLDADHLSALPESGGLFSFRPGVAGLPRHPFKRLPPDVL